WILPEIEPELFQYICGVARNLKSPVIAINGVEDHLHVLLLLGKGISSSDLLSEIKSSSSRWIKTKGNKYQSFCWQRGYGAFSVSRTNLESAVKYVAKQKEHHRTMSFKDEFLAMLQRAKIAYDEKYLWD
ncbi:MAG: transposase, partial [Chlamydiota bacterium]